MTEGETGVGLSVAEAAARVGLTAHTLRWYEQEGLLPPVARDAAGRRRYRQVDLGRLGILTRLRTTGMPVSEMRRYAKLAEHGADTLPERGELLAEHRDRVLARLEQLRRDLDVIEQKIISCRAGAGAVSEPPATGRPAQDGDEQ